MAARDPAAGVGLPGPGTYESKLDMTGGGFLGDAPSYTLAARRRNEGKGVEASPGPIYTPRSLTATSHGPVGDAPKYGFGSQQRFCELKGTGPAPGHYTMTSTVGTAPPTVHGAPKISFGLQAQRESTEKTQGNVYISEYHAKESNFAMHSPGPLKYNIEDTLGVYSMDTMQPNSPRYSMRSRLGAAKAPGRDPANLPGPAAYNKPSAFGDQPDSSQPSASAFSFGKSVRVRPEINPSAAPFLGKEMAFAYSGVASPGPCKYDTRTPRGSKERATPSYAFGREDRFG